jgi:hypothetical protein
VPIMVLLKPNGVPYRFEIGLTGLSIGQLMMTEDGI